MSIYEGFLGVGATFSPCRTWRYALVRGVNPSAVGIVAFIGLNPSTAGQETGDDPTIRRCMGFARAWGYGRIVMLNLYAYRSTDPAGLWDAEDPVGPANDLFISEAVRRCGLVVCAWGMNAKQGRVRDVLDVVPYPHALGFTKAGHPRHPLYMKAGTRPVAWGMAA